MQFSVLALAVAASAAFGAPALPTLRSDASSTACCEDLTLSIPVTSNNIKFTGVDQYYNNQTYITEQFLQLATEPQVWTAAHVTNETIVNTKTYAIHARYCTPTQESLTDAPLIVALHGINYNSKYWDFDYSPEYSLVQAATAKGYSILIYDRLGTGQSQDTTNGFDEPQAATEVEILAGVLSQLRAGTAVTGQTFSKIVGVGHSFGSAQMQGVTNAHPELLDGVVLTGFSLSSTSFPTFLLAGSYTPVRDVFPDRFANKPAVWVASGDDASHIEQFFWPPNYPQGVFDLARQYVDGATISSFATITTVIKPATSFGGPVFVQTGSKDLIFCGTNCTEASLAAVKGLYPMVDKFSTDFVLDTGHGLVTHYSGPQSLQNILSFISDNF